MHYTESLSNMKHSSTGVQTLKHPISETDLFFRMSSDLLIILRFDLSIVRINKSWETLLGYTEKEILSCQPEFIHADDLESLRKKMVRLIAGRDEIVNYDTRVITRKGEIKDISWNATADFINGLVYAQGRDITELKYHFEHLRNSEEKFQFFSENSREGLCISTNGIIRKVNKTLLDLLGYDSEDAMIGKPDIELIDEKQRTDIKKLINKGQEVTYHTSVLTKKKTRKMVEITSRNFKYQGKPGRIAVIKDIHDKQSVLARIREGEERFKAVFQNSSLGIILCDASGQLIDANKTLLGRLGYTREEFMKLSVKDIFHKDDMEYAMQYLQNIESGNSDASFSERRFIRKNGGLAWSKVTCSLLEITPDEKIVLGLIEDIDAQKRNELALFETEEKFRAVFESSSMGILIAREPGIIGDVNPAFAEMLGYKKEKLIGKNILEITHPADVMRSEKWMEKIYSKAIPSYTFEKRYLKKDGSTVWIKEVVSVMNISAEGVTTVGIMENIDRKKKSEQTIEQKNKELTQINQELEHFAYVASHDLQEPLRTITSFIQILEKRYRGKIDEDGQQFMGFVVEGAKRMQTLIHDLLEYSRINRFNTSYEEIDLNDIFTTVNRVLKEKIDSNDAIVLSEHLPVIHGSRLQLTQVFQNLIDNAIKFRGKKKPEITISVKDAGEKWELLFKDNGIGISREYYQRIFIIFQRLHTREEYNGTGIGLAICKKIIERHGGEVWVDSKPGKGTIFHLTIAKNLMLPVH